MQQDLAGRNALVYARKSTVDPKNPGKSIADQTDDSVAACRGAGMNIVAVLSDDGIGASRHSPSKVRAGFEEAMRLIQVDEPPIHVLAMWELSRATRKIDAFGHLMDLCEKFGVLLLIGGRVYNPADGNDRMILGIHAVIDENEASRIRERTMRGIASSALMGRPHGRYAYGYRRIYDSATRRLIRVEIVPEEAAVVREIGERLLAGASSRGVARDLTARGIPSPGGGVWHHVSISKLVSNPRYAGKRSHNGKVVADAMWPALFTDEEFERLAARFTVKPMHSTNPKYLLTGVVFCQACEKPMYRQPHRSGRGRPVIAAAYRCPACLRTRNAEHLERYVLKVVNTWLADEDFRVGLLKARRQPNTIAINTKLLELRTEREEALMLLQQGKLSARAVSIIEARVEPEIQRLEHELANVLASGDRAVAFLATGANSLPEEPEHLRKVLRDLIRVRCLPARRGPGFDFESVEVDPA